MCTKNASSTGHSKWQRIDQYPPSPRVSSPGSSQASVHPLLQFGSPAHKARFTNLSPLPIQPSYYFLTTTLDEVGLRHIVRSMIANFKWDLFVQIYEPVYWELLLEFLSTFSFEKTKFYFPSLLLYNLVFFSFTYGFYS